MLQNNNIENLENAAKKYAEMSYEVMEDVILEFKNKPISLIKESILDWTELDFLAGANWQKEQYKYLIQSHAELVEVVKMMIWAELNGEYEAQKQGKPRLADRMQKARSAIEKAENTINSLQ